MKIRNVTILLTIILVCGGPALAEVDTTGLMAWYPFSGNAGDSSGHGNHGTVYGATPCADRFGKPNSAYGFDGEDDYILVPDAPSLDFTTALTISAWINPSECPVTDGGAPILCKGYGAGGESYLFDIVDNTTLRFLSWSGGSKYEAKAFNWLTPAKVGQWIHLAIVYNGESHLATIYENGMEIAANSGMPLSLTTNNHELSIGSRQSSSSTYDMNIYGALDDILIFNRALSQDEIDSLAGNAALTTPILIAPEDGASLAPPNFPVFLWHKVDSADYYRFQLSTSSSFPAGSMVEDFTLNDTAAALFAVPQNSGPFWWRVTGHHGIYSKMSETRTFGFWIPQLIAPAWDTAFCSTNTPSFIWHQADSATYYHLWVARDSGFSDIVINHSLADTSYTPAGPLADGHYYWKVKAYGVPLYDQYQSETRFFAVNVYGGVVGQPVSVMPKRFYLSLPYPNPARSSATVRWELPEPGQVRLDVYNIAGHRVTTLANGTKDAGQHEAVWDLHDDKGSPVANGVYLYRLLTGSFQDVQRLTVVR